MRTTVTIDPDVENLLRKSIRAEGRPFKQVLNDALRRGLKLVPKPAKPFVQRTVDMGVPLVDLTHTGRLLDDLEVADFLEKAKRGA